MRAATPLLERSAIRTPVATTEKLRELDEAQFDLGQGPCREAIRSVPTVVVDDLATDPRWPEWGRAMVEELGIRSSLSFRLFTRPNDTWGALNVYSRSPHAFDQEDVVHGQTIAAMAAVVLARSINDDHLARALETRTVIGEAIGILMERYDIDAKRSFDVIRRLSSQSNVKLRDWPSRSWRRDSCPPTDYRPRPSEPPYARPRIGVRAVMQKSTA